MEICIIARNTSTSTWAYIDDLWLILIILITIMLDGLILFCENSGNGRAADIAGRNSPENEAAYSTEYGSSGNRCNGETGPG